MIVTDCGGTCCSRATLGKKLIVESKRFEAANLFGAMHDGSRLPSLAQRRLSFSRDVSCRVWDIHALFWAVFFHLSTDRRRRSIGNKSAHLDTINGKLQQNRKKKLWIISILAKQEAWGSSRNSNPFGRKEGILDYFDWEKKKPLERETITYV